MTCSRDQFEDSKLIERAFEEIKSVYPWVISIDKPEASLGAVVRRQEVEFDHIGEYIEIDRPHRLVFT